MNRTTVCLSAALALSCGLLAWSARYQYSSAYLAHVPVRVNRLTGTAELLAPGYGWLRADAVEPGTLRPKGEAAAVAPIRSEGSALARALRSK
jgi:hypothetical protein